SSTTRATTGTTPADVAAAYGAATARDAGSRRGPIDAFVVAALQRHGLQASPPAAPSTILRRVALDLTGLPPRLELVAEFEELLAAGAPDAYERIVDRLLASPGYAERMAMNWLDAARYADTNGYNNDEERSMWPWRDWVIEAYRRQMPFDQFVVEQLAGDQLPNATLAQKIATGFNRNHALTTEGGIIEEEYRVEYVADRLHTTATVFLGLSLQCARCHDHKYDPFTQREYYQLFAFFNHLPHQSVGYARGGVAEPSIKAPTRAQELELARLTQRRDELNAALKAREAAVDPLVAAWERSLTPEQKTKLGSLALLLHLQFDEKEGGVVFDVADSQRQGQVKGSVQRAQGRHGRALEFDGQNYVDLGQLGALESDRPFSLAAWVYPQRNEVGALLSKMDDAKAYRGYDVLIESGRISSHLIDHWPDNGLKVVTKSAMSLNQWHQVTVTYDGSKKAAGVKVYVDGKSQELEIVNDKLQGTLQTDKPLHLGRRHASTPLVGRLDDVRIYGREVTSDEAARLAAGEEISGLDQLLAVAPEQRTETQREMLRRYYLDTVDGDFKKLRGELAELPKRQAELEKAIPAVMIMQDQPQPRETRVLRRGQYDQLGDVVTASVPS
ncbi:MAG TPA: DUF1549 domain-containing protein, partial [Pirellulaceae bacterium]|nr:DUF1549 domain-containing protein [Pirellulaceae bacterium]